jgi:hypothetical protein
MQTPALMKIEKDIQQLPLNERLLLIEQLARQLRMELAASVSIDAQLSLMANDPAIRREIRETA